MSPRGRKLPCSPVLKQTGAADLPGRRPEDAERVSGQSVLLLLHRLQKWLPLPAAHSEAALRMARRESFSGALLFFLFLFSAFLPGREKQGPSP